MFAAAADIMLVQQIHFVWKAVYPSQSATEFIYYNLCVCVCVHVCVCVCVLMHAGSGYGQ